MAVEEYWRVYEVASEDKGLTWSWWSLLFEDARHPHICLGNNGEILRAAWCEDCGIRAIFQMPGGPVSSIFLFRDAALNPFLFEDDSFCVVQDKRGRWILHARLVGGTDTSLFYSDDRCATWTWHGTLLSGCVNPCVTVSTMGVLLFSGQATNTLHGRLQWPGDATPRGTFVFSAGATLVTVAEGGTFGIASAFEGPCRYVLAAPIEEPTDTFVATDWSSDDRGQSYLRLT